MSYKSSIFRSLFILLFLLCASVLSFGAVTLKQKKLGSLNLAAWVGSQPYPLPITPQLMVEEAEVAWASIPGRRNRKPNVVSALWAGGNTIFFASSAQGDDTVTGADELQIPASVHLALTKCAADDSKHNFGGKCGEIIVISEWLHENHVEELPKEKLIVTANPRKVLPPCQANVQGGTYGCTQFLKEMGFDSREIIAKDPRKEVKEACEIPLPDSPRGSFGKRACRRPSKATKPTKPTKPIKPTKPTKPATPAMAPKKGNVSKPKGAKPAPKRQTPARPVSRRPKHRRSVQPRWN